MSVTEVELNPSPWRWQIGGLLRPEAERCGRRAAEPRKRTGKWSHQQRSQLAHGAKSSASLPAVLLGPGENSVLTLL